VRSIAAALGPGAGADSTIAARRVGGVAVRQETVMAAPFRKTAVTKRMHSSASSVRSPLAQRIDLILPMVNGEMRNESRRGGCL